jgi:phage gpG-like protein
MAAFRTGDWALARRILEGAGARLKGAIETAVLQEAHALRKEIVEGITNQAPGGQAITPLAATTLAARQLGGFGGSKALIRQGDLRNSITVVADGDGAFVGVLRKSRAKSGESAANIAEIHEFGAGPFVVPMTPKMRRFLFAMLRKAGIEPTSSGGGKGVVVIRIPPRPFLRPAFESFSKGVQKRFLRRIARSMGLGV